MKGKKTFKILSEFSDEERRQGTGTFLSFTPVRSSSAMLFPFPDTPLNENLDYWLHIKGKWDF